MYFCFPFSSILEYEILLVGLLITDNELVPVLFLSFFMIRFPLIKYFLGLESDFSPLN